MQQRGGVGVIAIGDAHLAGHRRAPLQRFGTVLVGEFQMRKAPAPEIEPGMGMLGRYPTHGESEAAQTMPRDAGPPKLSELAAVYLEGGDLDRGEYPLPSKRPVLNQKNLQFHPQVLPILVGSTVDFPNRDNLFHNVFSYSSPKEFDLGRYPKDDSRSVTFDKPGTIRVYCDIHSHMAATILVLTNPYFATPADDGTFVIPDVPEGKYRIILWFDRGVAERRAIEVEAGKTITVDFTY